MAALLILIGLIALLLLMAAILTKEMVVEKSVVINLPRQGVFDYIQYIRNHDHFNVWVMMDPTMKKEYQGTDGTVGFLYSWNSKHKMVGIGEQRITKINPGEGMEFGLRFIKPRPNVATSKMALQTLSPDQTRVTWGFYSTMKYPANLMRVMVQNMLAKDLQKGLDNLKTVLEKDK